MATPPITRNRLAALPPPLPTMAAPAALAPMAVREEDRARTPQVRPTWGAEVPDHTLPVPAHRVRRRILRAPVEAVPVRVVRLLRQAPGVGAGDARSSVDFPVGQLQRRCLGTTEKSIWGERFSMEIKSYEKIIPA